MNIRKQFERLPDILRVFVRYEKISILCGFLMLEPAFARKRTNQRIRQGRALKCCKDIMQQKTASGESGKEALRYIDIDNSGSDWFLWIIIGPGVNLAK